MKDSAASFGEAKTFVSNLPVQLEEYLDKSNLKTLLEIIEAFDQFFNVTSKINLQASLGQGIDEKQASDIGDHGMLLLLKLANLMERLELPHIRKEVEQLAPLFASWILYFGGRINHLESLVNAFAQTANSMRDIESLIDLSNLISQVVDACSTVIKQDVDKGDDLRPWRLLHINRGIVATRTHDLDIMKNAFDELLIYLPEEADSFFDEGMREMATLDYPQHVRELIAFYQSQQSTANLH